MNGVLRKRAHWSPLDRISCRILEWYVCLRRYCWAHKRLPNILSPSTFNEKVLHRLLFDRRPLLGQFADKVAVRDYIRERVGRHVLPEHYHVTADPHTIPFDRLPGQFVVKPSHAAGWFQIVRDKDSLDRPALIRKCETWLRTSFYRRMREWVYKDIPPRIIVEQLIDDGSPGVPNDYKFFVFDGRVEAIHATVGRYSPNQRWRVYDTKWVPFEELHKCRHFDGEVRRPFHLEEMIECASALGRGIDFIRVDCYDTPSRYYVGELTTTPGAAAYCYSPRSFDYFLGSKWRLPAASSRPSAPEASAEGSGP